MMNMMRRLTADNGSVSLFTALAIPALVGTMALGTETAFWYLMTRKLQNAADSAVIAASLAPAGGHISQAKAVARRYGLIDGANGIVVAAVDNAVCPAGGSDCFRVTITAKVPLILSPVVGFLGTSTLNGARSTNLVGQATAQRGASSRNYCLVALAGDGVLLALLASGAPKADLKGCGVGSNSAMRCNGHDLGADFGDAFGTNDGCGAVRQSGTGRKIADPYAARAASLPADACGGIYLKLINLLAPNKWGGAKTLGSTTVICGDLQLTGNVTITAPSDAVLIIRNGVLDTNGYSLQTAAGSSLALVFTGSNSLLHQHRPVGAGTLDITAPTTGTWAGVALYQDKALTSGIDLPEAASMPNWKITGLIYTPNVDLTFKGSVGKSSSGSNCVVIVANSFTIKGTGLVLSQSGCAAAGLSPPSDGSAGRGSLVS